MGEGEEMGERQVRGTRGHGVAWRGGRGGARKGLTARGAGAGAGGGGAEHGVVTRSAGGRGEGPSPRWLLNGVRDAACPISTG